MRQGDGLTAETVGALITAVVVVPLVAVSVVVVARVCRRHHRHKHQQQLQLVQQLHGSHQRGTTTATQYHDTGARGGSDTQRPRMYCSSSFVFSP